jgi:hypothetical protein
MYLFLNAYTDLQFEMIISSRRIWPHMPIFSSMLWLNRQYPKFDELLWVERSSGRIFIFTRTEPGNLR